MDRTQPSSFSVRPAALGLTLLFAAAAAATRMVPYEYRPMNFAAIGALALFAGSRLGLLPAIIAVIAAMGVSDVYLSQTIYATKDYSPAWTVYSIYAIYALLGWGLLRRTENPLKIGTAAFAGSVVFFLVTNFECWIGSSRYPQTLEGLMDCYLLAVPFYRGTLLGDLLFSGLLFGTHAVLVRTLAPAERPVPVTVTDSVAE
jgi:hypothetical protein